MLNFPASQNSRENVGIWVRFTKELNYDQGMVIIITSYQGFSLMLVKIIFEIEIVINEWFIKIDHSM